MGVTQNHKETVIEPSSVGVSPFVTHASERRPLPANTLSRYIPNPTAEEASRWAGAWDTAQDMAAEGVVPLLPHLVSYLERQTYYADRDHREPRFSPGQWLQWLGNDIRDVAARGDDDDHLDSWEDGLPDWASMDHRRKQ